MPDRYSSSADTHAMVARVAPVILELLGDGLPRSRHDIVAALAGQHAKDEVVRALIAADRHRLAGRGRAQVPLGTAIRAGPGLSREPPAFTSRRRPRDAPGHAVADD